MGREHYLNVSEVAQRFAVNVTTVYRLAQQGKLPGFKIGGQWRFSEQRLDSWVSGQLQTDQIQIENGESQAPKLRDTRNEVS